VTIFPPAGIVEMTSFSGAVFVASFFPALVGGLYLRWGTGHGAFWSMLLGMAATLLWRFGIRFRVAGMEEIHEIIPAFCLSVLVYIVVSRLTVTHKPDEAHLDALWGESRTR
jgi:Na+/pantothenate symporter